jgi:hypothetical protein
MKTVVEKCGVWPELEKRSWKQTITSLKAEVGIEH